MAARLSRIQREIAQLEELDADTKNPRFKLEQPINQGPNEYTVKGQIFPKSEIFNERSYLIQIKLLDSFPFKSPEVCFLTRMYHPNVGKNGTLYFHYAIIKYNYIF